MQLWEILHRHESIHGMLSANALQASKKANERPSKDPEEVQPTPQQRPLKSKPVDPPVASEEAVLCTNETKSSKAATKGATLANRSKVGIQSTQSLPRANSKPKKDLYVEARPLDRTKTAQSSRHLGTAKCDPARERGRYCPGALKCRTGFRGFSEHSERAAKGIADARPPISQAAFQWL